MPLDLHDIESVEPPGMPEDGGNVRATAEGKPKVAPNLKDALRKKFGELERTRVGDFDVPGYDGMLVARYRRLSTDEILNLAKGVPQGTSDRRTLVRASAALNADFLAMACVELFARTDEGELQPLGDDYPMRYDQSFAEMMGFEVTAEEGAREVVMRTFDHNDLALKRHSDEVDEWMTSLSVRTDEDLLGK